MPQPTIQNQNTGMPLSNPLSGASAQNVLPVPVTPARDKQATPQASVPSTQEPSASPVPSLQVSADQSGQVRSLADVLFSEKLITSEQLEKIRFESARQQRNSEDVIKDMGLVAEDKMVKAKSMLYGVPYVDLASTVVPKEAYQLLPEDAAKAHKAIPFAVSPEGVKVAMVDPLDIQAIRFLEQKLKNRVLAYSTTETQFEEAVSKLYGEGLESTAVSELVGEALEEVQGILEIEETGREATEEDLAKAGVSRVVNMLLESAVKEKASDIHVEPQKDKIRVRFRLNGVLVEKLNVPLKMGPALVSRIKILAQLKIDVKRVPQDGRFYVRVGKEEVDLRVSTLPTIFGEKVVVRLLKRGGGIMALEETGLRGNALRAYLDAITATNGIVLITGPTGSGKTNTLASSVAKINSPQTNVVTLEDPVEIKIPGVNQVQINVDAGLTFANGLRSILRQDPNIIMVGEIRDEETARLAVQAALTGHLVFSTLHTNNASGALPRLLDMGVESYLIASTVRVAVGQRLIRVLCPKCREAVTADETTLQKVKFSLSGMRDFNLEDYVKRYGKDGKLVMYKAKGCDECDRTGYSGRTGIFEVLKLNDTIGQMIIQHRADSEIEEQAKKEGMITMLQDGFLKALEGITTIEEVLRVTKV